MPAQAASPSSVRASSTAVATVLVAAALVAWIVTVARMRGMDDGPGTDLGGLGWFLGIWVTMMAAMMLPSVVPPVTLFARVSGESTTRRGAAAPVWIFTGAYLAVWAAYGLAAYALFRLVTAFDTSMLAWDRAGPYVAGLAIAAAGVYELTPLKRVCLRNCRSPLHIVVARWRDGPLGAFRMGAEHGAYCVGCCWALMIILFALGVMSLLWMAVVAAAIFAQKILPGGNRLSLVFAVVCVSLGVLVAAAPDRVPGLTRPDGDGPGMQMTPSN